MSQHSRYTAFRDTAFSDIVFSDIKREDVMGRVNSAGMAAACALLAGCGTTAMPYGQSAPPSVVAAPPVSITYGEASDHWLSASVLSVVTASDPGYLPTDPNWLQIRVRLANNGRDTVAMSRIGARITDGSVVGSATSGSELLKPPSLVREGLTNTGLGIGTMAAGALLFPPAAIVGGALMAFRPMFAADRVGRIAQRLNQEGLRAGPIAPGTNVSGLIFIPAVTGQDALVIFYEADGRQQSLTVPRRPN